MFQLSLTYKASYKTCLARGNYYSSFHGAKRYRDLQDTGSLGLQENFNTPNRIVA